MKKLGFDRFAEQIWTREARPRALARSERRSPAANTARFVLNTRVFECGPESSRGEARHAPSNPSAPKFLCNINCCENLSLASLHVRIRIDWQFLSKFLTTGSSFNGYGDRFGLIHVEFKTQKRTPKLSARWYREAARRNAVV